MRSPRRRMLACIAAPLLALTLAACATETEAEPEPQLPTIEPTPTDSVAAPTPPGSRVPATCEQLFDGVEGFTGEANSQRPGGLASTAALDQAVLNQAVLDQAGFDFCSMEGALGGTAVTIFGPIGVDVEAATVQSTIDFFSDNGYPTDIGGELSWTECRAEDLPSFCLTEVYAGGYLLEFSTIPHGSIAGDFDSSLRALVEDLGTRMGGWAEPKPAWQRPESTLAWAKDCDADVAATDGAIRAALPFDSEPPSSEDPGDGFRLVYEAASRQGVTNCVWRSGDYSSLARITIAPGAAWILDEGRALPGAPRDHPGALAASVVDDPRTSYVSVWVVIDGSLLIVDMDNDDDRPGGIEAAMRVVDAVVAEFGSA